MLANARSVVSAALFERTCGAVAALLGTAGLAGWAFSVPVLKGAVSDTKTVCSAELEGAGKGAAAFCTIRSYLATLRKQSRDLFESLVLTFKGEPPPCAKKRGRRIHRAQAWAGGLCASLLALAAVNCRAGETAAATNAAGVPAESGVAQLKKLSVEELMDIEVTSVSKRPESLSETASAIQVITQEDIRRVGATRLPEALRLASNLEVAQVDSRQWAISARGFNSTASNKLLVLIDGRTVYTPLFAGVFWDVQDTLLDDIDRIEVISGPGATLWGANAVNGVINIITKNTKNTQGPLLLGGGGTELNGFGGMRYGGALGPNLRYRVYGKYFDRDSTVLPDGQDASDDWHMGQGGFRMDWDASESNVFTVQGDGYDGRIS